MIFREMPPPRGELGISTQKRPASEMIGGQRRALGAALLLHHLHQQDLPAVDDLLDLVVAQEARRDAALASVFGAVAFAANGLRWRLFRDRFRGVAGLLDGIGCAIGTGFGVARIAGLQHFHRSFGRLRCIVAIRVIRCAEILDQCIDAIRTGGRFGLHRVPLRRRIQSIERRRDRLAGDRSRLGGVALVWLLRRKMLACGIRFGRIRIRVVRMGCVRLGSVRLGFVQLGGHGPCGRRFVRSGLGRFCGTILLLLLAPRVLGLHLDQTLPVGDGDLVVVGMDLAKGEEAMAVAAILDEGGLEAGFYANHLGQVDIALELSLGRSLDVEIF